MQELKKGEYRVLFESHGMLYVEYGENVFKMKNPYDYTPEKVALVKVDNELYISGFEPKTTDVVTKKDKKKKRK